MEPDTSGRYDKEYWRFQRPIGEAGTSLDAFKFSPHVRPEDVVLDFGCGGGFILSALDCSRRIGVEWGDAARSVAADRGIEVFQWSAEVPPSSVDIVISNHALEHAHRPLDELRELARVLVEDGELVLVVPLDDWRKQRRPDTTDPNHHLYGWTPLLLANLCTEAGFRVRDCRILAHAWRPGFVAAQRRLPRRAYRLLTLLYSVVLRRRQIKIVCEKRRVRPQPEEYARRRARSHAIPYS